MLHAYVRKFDVTDTVAKILATKQGPNQTIALRWRACTLLLVLTSPIIAASIWRGKKKEKEK